jgi:hypothetical protein
MSGHFVVACPAFPFFSFVVSELREMRKAAGMRFPTGTVRFAHGLLDSAVAGLSEAEAAVVLTHLKAMHARPAWGHDIGLYEEPQGAEDVPPFKLSGKGFARKEKKVNLSPETMDAME